MDWRSPVSISNDLSTATNDWRLKLFFGHFDARVYLTETAYIDLGAGSLDCELRVSMVSEEAVGSLGSIGRFCALGDCEVMALGEHDHQRPVNVGLIGTPIFASMLKQEQAWLKPNSPISIGNNVVISSGAKVLPGVAVGDGSVIAAGAVVARAAGRFGIYGGVPATRLKDRPTCVPWWDFHPAYMAELASANRLDEAAATEADHQYQAERPRIAYRRVNKALEFVGIVSGETVEPVERQPEKAQAYLRQAFGNGPFVWWADPWAD